MTHRLVDQQDAPAELAKLKRFAIATLAATALALWWSARGSGIPAALFLGAIFLPLGSIPMALYVLARREAKVASPGELELDDWPLRAGAPTVIRFKRRIHGGGDPGKVIARLELMQRSGEAWSIVDTIKLAPHPGVAKGRLLEAKWRITAPHPSGDRPDTGEFAWWLKVEIKLSEGVTLDSSFRLACEEP
ncbi:MAG: hypothetical protein JWM80_6426 [Cyanobacteria bacterium RYN_339]|nr:hypothetical protein [Cyanobacteria bacterium RYN_339]